jgi:hypothetical protein
MNKIIPSILSVVLYTGVIDSVSDEFASIEIIKTGGGTSLMTLPVDMFPCMVTEGSLFYFERTSDTVEIKCGTPT